MDKQQTPKQPPEGYRWARTRIDRPGPAHLVSIRGDGRVTDIAACRNVYPSFVVDNPGERICSRCMRQVT